MPNYSLVNRLTGWFIFLIAAAVYTLTLEPTASFWDCGEFISGAYKLQVVHPPGAPLFLLIGRVFTMFAPSPETVAWTINFMSGLSSAFGVLFVFWIITHLAKKLVAPVKEALTTSELLAIMGAGVVGALACTFLDTYWFSAVEGEVYALSTFLIILVFWAIMKWESEAEQVNSDKWLLFIAFVLGLAIGVHLMSLLAIPAIALVYYFRRYETSAKGVIAALLIGMAVLVFTYIGIVSIFTNIIAKMDLVFVNTFGLPFGSGIIFLVLLVIGGLVGMLRYSHKHNMPVLNTAMLGIIFIFIGYSPYTMVAIRANANPPINMNRPSDIFTLQSYLNREQYGDRPLLYGPHYNGYPIDVKDEGTKYAKGEDKYIEAGERVSYEFNKADMMPFPRLGSWQDERHATAYRIQLGLAEDEDPSFKDNMYFFFNYQIGYMWFRYFMWNFSGRQNDVQGIKHSNNDGNWITGFDFIDNGRIGPVDIMPDAEKNNAGRNTFFLIPFIIGIIGMFYQYSRSQRDFWVVMTLFLFTGILEIIYFNSPPFEPRERDYTLIGSFVTYTIWIGLGVIALFDFFRRRTSPFAGAGIAIALCLTAPVLMATEGWNDHDRSKRYTARDFAVNYLESCAPNAILFTQGDNDTYPLWYAQEVEGIRTDVRVVNLSLLGVDWYIDQLKYAINDAAPVKLSLTSEKYRGNKNDVVRYYDSKRVEAGRAIELSEMINFIGSEDRRTQLQVTGGDFINYYPTKTFKITVNKAEVEKQSMIPEDLMGKMVDEITWTISKNNLLKNDLLCLDILASNLWERPIYFAVSVSPDSYLDLQDFFQLEGLTYRLVPVKQESRDGMTGYVAEDIMYENVINDFQWGNLAHPSVYLDENIMRMTMNLRSNFGRLAGALLDSGKKEEARAALNKALEVMPKEKIPYNIFMLRFPDYFYKLGEKEKARELIRSMADIYVQEYKYYSALGSRYDNDSQRALAVLQELARMANINNDAEMQEGINDIFTSLQGIS